MTELQDSAQSRLILALDCPSLDEALALARETAPAVGCFKVGLQLFLKEGRAAVDEIGKLGVPIFLDLKLHDIPATVANAVKSLSDLPVRYITIHTGGGRAMMEAAQEATVQFKTPPTLLGVTVLTSMGAEDLEDVGAQSAVEEVVLKRALLAQKSGLGGIVASSREVASLRAALGPKFKLVIPGIRPAQSGSDDQKRVATPAQALAWGASELVIGRPIRSAPSPLVAAQEILAEIQAALKELPND